MALPRQAPSELAPARNPSPSSAAWPSSTPTRPSAGSSTGKAETGTRGQAFTASIVSSLGTRLRSQASGRRSASVEWRFELPSNDHWAQLGFQKSAYGDGRPRPARRLWRVPRRAQRTSGAVRSCGVAFRARLRARGRRTRRRGEPCSGDRADQASLHTMVAMVTPISYVGLQQMFDASAPWRVFPTRRRCTWMT